MQLPAHMFTEPDSTPLRHEGLDVPVPFGEPTKAAAPEPVPRGGPVAGQLSRVVA